MPTFKSKLARYNSFCCEQVMPVPVIPKCAISVCLPIPICELSTDICTPPAPPRKMIPTQYPWPAPLDPPGTFPCYYKPSPPENPPCAPCAPCGPCAPPRPEPPSYPPPGTAPQQKVQIPNYPPPEEPCTGTILTNLTGSVPAGYLPCDGFEVSRTTYANLFSVVGVYFGEGDNTTTFNLPNLEDQNGTGISYIIKT
jgi:hypothetical protein